MKKTIALVIILLLASLSNGQNNSATVRGMVTNSVTKEKLQGVNVLILDKEYTGATTNRDGEYTITGLTVGICKLRFSLVGYETLTVEAFINSAAETVLNAKLIEYAIPLNEVLITAQTNNQLNDVRSGTINIKPMEIKKMPGGAEDILRSLKNLPGVTGISDISAQFAVRGSGPEENLILIDGFEVLNPYRLYGFTSMFNPETVSEIILQKGGFSADYGDRLSSVLSISSRNGNTNKPLSGKINISLTNMNMIFEGRLPVFENSSYLISARRTYYDLIAGPILKSSKVFDGNVALPNFRDLQGKFTMPVNDSHLIQINLLASSDAMNLLSSAGREKIDSINANDISKNSLIGLTYHFIPAKDLLIETKLSYYRNTGVGTMGMSMANPTLSNENINRNDASGISLISWDQNYDYNNTKKSIFQKLTWINGMHSIEFGYGVDALKTNKINYIRLDENFKEYLLSKGLVIPGDVTESMRYNKLNLFLSDALTIQNLTLKAGLRVDNYPVLKEKVFLSPRLSMSYRINESSTIRAAYGVYYQSPGMEKQDIWNNISYSKENLANLVPESSEHYILGYEKMLNESWQFKTEAYYKKLTNVIVPMKINVDGLSAELINNNVRNNESWLIINNKYDSLTSIPINGATGDAYGIELMLEKINTGKNDKFNGWVSYSLSFANRERDGKKSPFIYDQRHALNIVGNYKFAESWELGLNFTLRSGKPYNMALGVQPRIQTLTVNGTTFNTVQVNENGEVLLDVDYEKDNYSGRLNMYHSLNLRLTKYMVWFGLDWSFYLDVQNIYNRKNQEQADYYVDKKGTLKEKYTYGFPVFPSLGLSVSF